MTLLAMRCPYIQTLCRPKRTRVYRVLQHHIYSHKRETNTANDDLFLSGSCFNSVTLIKELAAANSGVKSPIFVACVHGIVPILERLSITNKSIDWNAKNIRGAPAIYLSVRFGQLGAARYLLEKGADVNSEGGVFGNSGQAAAFNGHIAVLELLASHGVDLSASGRFPNTFHAALIGNQSAVMKLLLEGLWVHEIGSNNDDLLCRAAYYGHHEVVEILLR
ncbi:ankyrin repeat-containing domain protein [Xylaria sp. FL1042]|nr:ankyrin repeat-containing domain protein [Xylaria sp. FL1042]